MRGIKIRAKNRPPEDRRNWWIESTLEVDPRVLATVMNSRWHVKYVVGLWERVHVNTKVISNDFEHRSYSPCWMFSKFPGGSAWQWSRKPFITTRDDTSARVMVDFGKTGNRDPRSDEPHKTPYITSSDKPGDRTVYHERSRGIGYCTD